MKERTVKFEVPLLLLCSLGLLYMISSILHDYERVHIQKRLPLVQMSFFKRLPGFKQDIQKPDEDASSEWDFECASEMDYSLFEKQKSGNHWLVRLRIDAVRVRLALPVKVALPETASNHLKAHEDGHVEICKKVYEDADRHVRLAVQDIMQRTYAGQGETLDEASQSAVAVATRELADLYRRQTLDVVNDVSEIYDFLQRKPDSEPEKSVVEAFKRYEEGKPRRV